jgi:hypothetical protein
MRWTATEKDFLIANYKQLPIKVIAQRLKRSEKAVYRMAHRLGLHKRYGSYSITRVTQEKSKRWVEETLNKLRDEVTENDLSYIAGLFNGDGFVYLKSQGKVKPILKAGISGTYEDVLKWVEDRLKVGHIYPTSRANKQCYSYECLGWQAMLFLEAIMPYLRVKQKEALDKIMKWLNLHGGEDYLSQKEKMDF